MLQTCLMAVFRSPLLHDNSPPCQWQMSFYCLIDRWEMSNTVYTDVSYWSGQVVYVCNSVLWWETDGFICKLPFIFCINTNYLSSVSISKLLFFWGFFFAMFMQAISRMCDITCILYTAILHTKASEVERAISFIFSVENDSIKIGENYIKGLI